MSSNTGGTIQWLSRKDSLDEPWDVHFIGKIPSTHRMRWADVLGTQKPQLVVSPLNKSGDDPGVRLAERWLRQPAGTRPEPTWCQPAD